VKLTLLVKDRVFSSIRWTSRTIFLGAVPSVIRVGVCTTFGLVHTVYLLIPVPVAVVVQVDTLPLLKPRAECSSGFESRRSLL
jgi:hypothetical protein